MLSKKRHRVTLGSAVMIVTLMPVPLAQTWQASQRKRNPRQTITYNSTTNVKRQASRMSLAEAEAAREALLRLRILRDSWNDPPPIYPNDDYRYSGDPVYLIDRKNYDLYVAEAAEAVKSALALVKDSAIRREINTAIAVLNDLSTIYKLFNSKKYYFSRTVTVSDIFSFVRAYNIPYESNSITKDEVYRRIVPARRPPIDRLAALIPGGVPPDPNPTLTPEQTLASADEKDWTKAVEIKAYDWYLQRYPQGRHVGEAQSLIAEQQHIEAEMRAVLSEVINALVRGDKATLEKVIAADFPKRTEFLTPLMPQTKVRSYEIEQLSVQGVLLRPDQRNVTSYVLYRSYDGRERRFTNEMTFAKRDGRWQIISGSHSNNARRWE